MTLPCSLVIATKDRLPTLEALLTTLRGAPHRPTEILVVDNSNGDPRTEAVARAGDARYLNAPEGGLSAARNRGARAAQCDIVAFLDDDAIPLAGWLPELLAPFGTSSIVATAGRIVPHDLAEPAQRLFAAHGGFDNGTAARVVGTETSNWFEICNFGGVGHGGNLAIRRSAFESWGGFRESLGLGTAIPGNEEHHAFFSLVRAGHHVAYAPTAVVTHPYPASMRAARAQHVRAMTGFAGYVCLLLIEEPRYRRRVLRYLLEAVRGTRREWRPSPSRSGVRIVPPRITALALLRGPYAYARTNRAQCSGSRDERPGCKSGRRRRDARPSARA